MKPLNKIPFSNCLFEEDPEDVFYLRRLVKRHLSKRVFLNDSFTYESFTRLFFLATAFDGLLPIKESSKYRYS